MRGDADASIVTAGLRMNNVFEPSTLTFPALGSASLNGSSDYIQLDTPFSYTNHTIAAWVYIEDNNDSKYFFDARDADDDGIRLISRNDESIRYSINTTDVDASASYKDDWFFVVGTYDGTTQKLYIDGSIASSQATSQTISTTTNATIGKQSFADSRYMYGNLANVAIWNRALHPDEINAIMWKSYNDLNAIDKNGLQAWYALDNITGTTVPDSTGTNNGTAN